MENNKPSSSEQTPPWHLIEEDEPVESPKGTMDVPLDLGAAYSNKLKVGVFMGVLVLLIGAFIFAPWENPLRNFMGNITEDTAFEDLFNAGQTEPTVTEQVAPETTALLPEEELDALAQLFGETPAAETTRETSVPTETAIPASPETVPLPNTEEVPVSKPVTPATPDDLENLTPAALPATTPIVTLPSTTPVTVTPTPVIAPTPTPTVAPAENLLPAAPTVPTPTTTASPFPENPYTVDRVKQLALTSPQIQSEELHGSAPAYPLAASTVQNYPAYRQVPESGPEHLVLIGLFILCSILSWLHTRKNVACD